MLHVVCEGNTLTIYNVQETRSPNTLRTTYSLKRDQLRYLFMAGDS